MKISLIIPVYNVEQYIERCLTSCLEQDIPQSDYEIIVVNDGSPDGSLAIAERIAATASNMTIVSQKNGGLSAARNTGLKLAKGDYIWFIDSDDTIEKNCLEKVTSQCQEEALDLLAICAANVVNGEIIRRFSYNDNTVIKGVELLSTRKIQHCAPFTIYRREFLEKHKLQFYVGIYHEDSEWSPRIYFYAQKVGFTNDILYYVTTNPNSITRSINPQKGLDYLTVAKSIDDFYRTLANTGCSRFFHNHISLMLNNGMSNFADKENMRVKELEPEFRKKLNNNKHLYKHLIKSTILKYKIEGILFLIFPRHTLDIYRHMSKFK